MFFWTTYDPTKLFNYYNNLFIVQLKNKFYYYIFYYYTLYLKIAIYCHIAALRA